MCGTTKIKDKSKLTLAIAAFYAAGNTKDEAFQAITLEAKRLENALQVALDTGQETIQRLNALADDLNATVLEQARIIVNLESRLADASQAIATVDADIAPFFAPREVDTSSAVALDTSGHEAAESGGTPVRRGRVAIERKQGGHCGIPLEWVQVDVVEAGAEEAAIKFLKSENSYAEFRAVTLLEAL